MITFLAYQLKVAVIMAVFYIFYRLFLIKDTWHRLNRIVLLSTALLSFLLPVCIITIHKTEVQPMPVVQLMQAVSSTPARPSILWWHITLITVYALGVVFVLARVLASALRVRNIIRCARKEVMSDGTVVYIMPGNAASFSWMGHIVISEADWNNNESAIIRHEKAHVALRHSIDVLITDIIAALQWFNPAIWMLRIDLRAVHEYEADDTVLRSGTDLRSYQYLLISKAAAMNGYTIANNFNPTANAESAIPRISVVDSESDMNIDLSGFSSESVDKIIKALPGAEFDEDGNITVNGKPVKKILVNGKEYNSGDPYNIYVSRIVEEVEGEVPDGHNRVTTVTVNENGQVSITNKDKKAPANTSDK